MSVWHWIAIILVCCAAAAFATCLVTKDITLRKEAKDREERLRELRIEEELQANTAQKACHMYVVDIIPLGNDQTNFNMPEEPSWNYPHIEIPDYMMDRAHWNIKENFEYFKPYGFKIAQEVDINGTER